MKQIHCIIAEDEQPAQRVLESYIARIPELMLLQTFGNALETMRFLQDHSVDLIFLDIHLPEMSGLEFLETLEVKPAVIITTAYGQYALDGFERGVVDYLLKPYSFQRFCKAINRYRAIAGRSRPQPATGSLLTAPDNEQMIIRTDSGETALLVSDIVCVEACGNYLKINCVNARYVVRDTLSGFHQK